MIEEKAFREVMGHFPTGVTILTTRDGGGVPVGLTVSAFTSVSLDPVLLLVCIHKDATAHDLLVPGAYLTLSILSSDQAALAVRFASGVAEERFSGVDVVETPIGNQTFPGALAWLDCRVTEVYPGGDHSVILAAVIEGRAQEGDPLLFHRGALKGLGP